MKFQIQLRYTKHITSVWSLWLGLILYLVSSMWSNVVVIANDSLNGLNLCNGSFYVYRNSKDACNNFIPSGWMGDIESISFDSNSKSDPYSGKSCTKVTFTANGDNWAGIYWQYPENNWGSYTGYNLTGATEVSFWVKGSKGSETVEFFAGGIGWNLNTNEPDPDVPHPDSFPKISTGFIELKPEWQEYKIPLTGQDLTNVIGGFGWSTNSTKNPNEATFFLDEIKYNGFLVPTPTPIVTPISTPVPTPTQILTPTPTPTCNAANLDAGPEPLKLKKEEGADETVTVACENGTPVARITVTATVRKGKKCVSVSPASAVTDVSGQATFTITAKKKTGNAKIRFEADGLRDNVSVKVE